MKRESKDKVVGNEGRELVDLINEKGWHILNGCTEGDWEGNYMYVGARGCIVIDYIIVNESVRERVLEFRVEDEL